CFWSGRSARSMPRYAVHTPGWSGVQPRRSPSLKSSANNTFCAGLWIRGDVGGVAKRVSSVAPHVIDATNATIAVLARCEFIHRENVISDMLESNRLRVALVS